VVDHFVERDREGVLVAEEIRAQGIADQNEIDARVIRQTRARKIPKRKRRDRLTPCFFLLQTVDTNLVTGPG